MTYTLEQINKACFYAGSTPEELTQIINTLQNTAGTPGTPGPQGVGIKTITGSISASNLLTLTITLTDNKTQTVTGQITPPSPAV